MGVAVGDYDNDGRDDVYITALEGDRLFHNEGGGKFRDVTKAAGIDNANFGTSAAWLDYDRDGKLDLFVANYVQWTPKADLWCSLDGATKSYCTPESYKGTSSKLLSQPRQRASSRTFDRRPASAIRRASRWASPSSTTTAMAGPTSSWPTTRSPTSCIATTATARSARRACRAGVAYGEDGVARGAMGADAADYDRIGPAAPAGRQLLEPDARPLSQRGQGVVRRRGAAFDRRPRQPAARSPSACSSSITTSTASRTSSPPTATSRRRSAASSRRSSTRQPPLLFRNRGAKRFEDVTAAVGSAFSRPMVARGAAYADYDHDGDLDVVVSTNNGPAYLYRNDGGNRISWIAVRTRGIESNRDGIGAVVRVESAGGSSRDGAERIELRVTERSGADVRARRRSGGECDRGRVAERHQGSAHECRRAAGGGD